MTEPTALADRSTGPELNAGQLAAVQRRTIAILAVGQILGGISFGATVSLGAILAARISGDDALSGLATASITLGTALTAVPLAALARRRGRRPALATGMLVALAGVGLVITAVALAMFPLLLAGFVLIGAGQAANLQSRFAAADLATDASRARDLSLVVWATTIGAVLGPNLVGPGELLGDLVGMPELTGPYLFTIIGQLAGIALYLVALRPDPLLTAHQVIAARSATSDEITHVDRPRAAAFATVAIVGAHVVMVSIMAMTPIHLVHHGATLTVVGLTLSLHIAGMYALSPVFGILADRWGRVPTILLGYAILAACVAVIALAQHSTAAVTVALVLLGVGWSAATVAGAALLTESSAETLRTRRQGRNDFWMSLIGALGAIGAGSALGWAGFNGLALLALPVLVVVVLLSPLGRRAS
ncbi:MAG: MFS transporter [Propionicimonas sp.]|uniref:MFS transporter n=1 Tax=Propionicimonas sp. TaxID=1955623 RepID=UPI002B2213D3|nr:MFS transporter [Propionicimonas sp.]MEA4943551.1 MFS transporter [Propionicimonas sp.]MEA5053394.1 MFS transporter [Propionicimonas sp.]MEA5117121.1 MFS transporter [Propionicimonas sp.]